MGRASGAPHAPAQPPIPHPATECSTAAQCNARKHEIKGTRRLACTCLAISRRMLPGTATAHHTEPLMPSVRLRANGITSGALALLIVMG